MSMKSIPLKYNYIFFNSFDAGLWRNAPDGYYSICARDLLSNKSVHVVSHPLDNRTLITRLLFAVHNSERIGKYIKFKHKNFWFPFYFSNPFSTDKPLCFVFLNYPPVEYLYYLRKHFPTCKFVKVIRDLVRTQRKSFEQYYNSNLFDFWFSFDEEEAKKYGFNFFTEFESKITVPIVKDYPLSDLFFAGRGKDRLPILISIYDYLEMMGIHCDFFIVGVPKNQQIHRRHITYSQRPLPYKEMLLRSVNSRCLLDINQIGASGFTSRFLEAVMYDKLLISNNASILSSKFYSSENIQIISAPEDIDISFFMKGRSGAHYSYNNEFSPNGLISQIDSRIVENEQCKN